MQLLALLVACSPELLREDDVVRCGMLLVADSAALEFSTADEAFVVFDYPQSERRDRRVDLVSFGLRTSLADCFVLSLESARRQRDGYHDFLEILIVRSYCECIELPLCTRE